MFEFEYFGQNVPASDSEEALEWYVTGMNREVRRTATVVNFVNQFGRSRELQGTLFIVDGHYVFQYNG